MKIAIIGTDGIPARYGGFETFVEQVVPYLAAASHEVLVVGSSVGRKEESAAAPGVRVVNLPMRANGASSVLFDILSFARVAFWADGVILLGVSAGGFVPIFRLLTRGSRLVVNVDGLESSRQKWGGLRGKYLRFSEAAAVAGAPNVVADNQGIADIVHQRYGRASTVIAYGADHVKLPPEPDADSCIRSRFGVEPRTYALTVARIEPENHIHLMIEGFLASSVQRYVVVGNFGYSDYGRQLRLRYAGERRVLLIESTYDAMLLASLRSRCAVYLHGHSVGGTNPSLVEMLPYARPILAWDCSFNRFTLRGTGAYFDSASSLSSHLNSHMFESFIPPPEVRSDPSYRWSSIAARYCELLAAEPA